MALNNNISDEWEYLITYSSKFWPTTVLVRVRIHLSRTKFLIKSSFTFLAKIMLIFLKRGHGRKEGGRGWSNVHITKVRFFSQMLTILVNEFQRRRRVSKIPQNTVYVVYSYELYPIIDVSYYESPPPCSFQ